jgi:hypothetical protein
MYVLPSIEDPENDVCFYNEISGPSWAIYIGSQYDFYPPVTTEIGDYSVAFSITDDTSIVNYSFTVRVTAAPVTN